MKAEVREVCLCALDVRPDIWRCSRCRQYRKGKVEYTSVSKVIKANFPADFSAVHPVVLECARLRGTFVDMYFTEWLSDAENVLSLKDVQKMIADQFPYRFTRKNSNGEDEPYVIPKGKGEKVVAEAVVDYTDRLINWWLRKNWKATGIHQIRSDETYRIAGETDVETEAFILDVKCVSELQPNYALQVGAYLTMDGKDRKGGIIHVTKDKIETVFFDSKKIQQQWQACASWYRTREELTKV